MVTAGLRWAPDIWPVDKMTIITASPVEAARPSSVSEPCVFWFTMAVAVPAKISIKVPMNSAPTYSWHKLISYQAAAINIIQKVQITAKYTFLAREMGGTGIEHETGGNAPSSKFHASTLKQVQLFNRDLLALLYLTGLNPPKRGAPGVPGVTGVDGAETTSSESIILAI